MRYKKMEQTEKLIDYVVKGLQEKKGRKIKVVDLSKLSGSVCDYMVICEGGTPTQVSALSDAVWECVRKEGGEKPLSVVGVQNAQWIGMDYGTVLVHIFLPEERQFYNLEHLWEDSSIIEVPDLN